MPNSSPAARRPRKQVPTGLEAADLEPRSEFPIVGIGASAGGLKALELFLEQMPADSGLAFVIVQHLDPTRHGIMAELLQRVTPMPVSQIKDRTAVLPNHVYVIPPNKDITLLNGVLHLLTPGAPRGLRLPIDFFLRSLAQDQREHAIGVILSGMGSDGTLGLRAIKENAGLALVQDPASAEFDSMPRSAIDAGLADLVAPVAELPGKILGYLQRAPLAADSVLEEKNRSSIEKVILLLRSHTGNDFTLYKRNTLHRRIERRMGLHQIPKMAAYVRYLQENSQELELLFKELLIGVTSFFRDPEAWEQLRVQAIPELLASRSPGHVLRAWVAGCSTGEEAYSLAILLREAIDELGPKRKLAVQIFATDLDRDAIEKARAGFFPAGIAGDVSDERLKRFFTEEDHGYRVRKEIREMVIFAPQNLIMDPPFTKLDIVSCRNLLIYLTAEVQKKLIPLFHYCLSPGGILFQGSAETIGEFTDIFSTVSGKSRIFRRAESVLRSDFITFPAAFTSHRAGSPDERPSPQPTASLQVLADQWVLQRYAPPAVLASDKGDIFYFSGRTGKYLEPAAGKANWNLFAMARDGIRYELTVAFQQVLRQAEPLKLQGLRVVTNGGTQSVDITVQRIDEPGPLHGLVMIVFYDLPPPLPEKSAPAKRPASEGGALRLAELERELLHCQSEARVTHEEMQTSQEELRSTNEELQSTNEELQSTNEELTTSKEEMQSLNEELQTVNSELQAKVDDLSRISNDMKNLLDSTSIATLFLDMDLKVRRFTPQATAIIQLIPGDVGRPITDLVSSLLDSSLATDAREVLRTLVAMEKPMAATDGRWFSMRIMPYRAFDERIDGVVVTFADITVAKTLEAKLRNNQAAPECNGGRPSRKPNLVKRGTPPPP